jgi:hypothetical protein
VPLCLQELHQIGLRLVAADEASEKFRVIGVLVQAFADLPHSFQQYPPKTTGLLHRHKMARRANRCDRF